MSDNVKHFHGDGCDPTHGSNDPAQPVEWPEPKAPEKTSRWTEAERERAEPEAAPAPPKEPYRECMHPSHFPNYINTGTKGERYANTCIGHSPVYDVPDPPPWIMHFLPESVITHAGWEAVVRHVGYEEGHWMVLLEPMRPVGKRLMSRSEYRRLKAQVGKKGVEKVLLERKAKVVDGDDSPPDGG